MDILNLLYVVGIIIVGGVFGSIAKHDGSSNSPSYLFGIATAFIAVPFTASFVKLDYNLLSIVTFFDKSIGFGEFIEHSLMLLSIAGISSYIGVSALDNIANTVLKKSDLDKVKDKLENNTELLKIDIARLKVISILRDCDECSPNNKELLKKELDKALSIIDEYKNIDSPKCYSFLILEAAVYKRLNDYNKAISIVNNLIDKYPNKITALYNKGCYLYLTGNIDEAKKVILDAIDRKAEDNETQEKIRIKIITKSEHDINNLFNDEEIDNLSKKYKIKK